MHGWESFLKTPSEVLLLFTVLYPLAPPPLSPCYADNVSEVLGVEKRETSRQTALSGTADWNLKVTAERERERRKNRERLTLQSLYLASALVEFPCVRVCVRVCLWVIEREKGREVKTEEEIGGYISICSKVFKASLQQSFAMSPSLQSLIIPSMISSSRPVFQSPRQAQGGPLQNQTEDTPHWNSQTALPNTLSLPRHDFKIPPLHPSLAMNHTKTIRAKCLHYPTRHKYILRDIIVWL